MQQWPHPEDWKGIAQTHPRRSHTRVRNVVKRMSWNILPVQRWVRHRRLRSDCSRPILQVDDLFPTTTSRCYDPTCVAFDTVVLRRRATWPILSVKSSGWAFPRPVTATYITVKSSRCAHTSLLTLSVVTTIHLLNGILKTVDNGNLYPFVHSHVYQLFVLLHCLTMSSFLHTFIRYSSIEGYVAEAAT